MISPEEAFVALAVHLNDEARASNSQVVRSRTDRLIRFDSDPSLSVHESQSGVEFCLTTEPNTGTVRMFLLDEYDSVLPYQSQ